jgi:hypothetical protein
MGQNISADDKHKPLFAQRVFEPTIHRRFIKDRMVSIELEDNFWTKPRPQEVELKDVRSGQVLFKLPPQDGNPATKSERKVLLDAFGVPVIGLQWTNQKPTNAEYIITPGGTNSANEEIFRFNTMFNAFFYPLKLVVNEESDNDCTILYVIGSWIARRSVVGIRRGIEGDVFKVAEFNAVGSVTNTKYRLDVAPGVDIALMIMFAAAMDEQARLHVCGSDRSALKTEIKREKLRLQKGMTQVLTAGDITVTTVEEAEAAMAKELAAEQAAQQGAPAPAAPAASAVATAAA